MPRRRGTWVPNIPRPFCRGIFQPGVHVASPPHKYVDPHTSGSSLPFLLICLFTFLTHIPFFLKSLSPSLSVSTVRNPLFQDHNLLNLAITRFNYARSFLEISFSFQDFKI
ncbi:hypothetical protein MRB53_003592 [Persea americana]|uniref:Uncharacterized protein n=1 Tax=Persea americana TaxID=3435 RepID=A0ACC2MXY4_PERAE|nr:hypothetical protein MRB53_003592 [Persea americana]